MPKVYRRNDTGVYCFDFRYRGQRITGTTGLKNRREAQRILDEEIAPARRAEVDDAFDVATSGVMLWQDARDRYWLEVGQFLAGGGPDNLRWSLDYLTDALGERKQIHLIDDGTVAHIVARRRGDGVQNATVNRSTTEPLRKVLRRADQLWGMRTAKIEWSRHLLPERERGIRELTEEEEARFVSNIRPDYLPVFLFSLASGVRLGGCLALRWDDVDWGARSLRIKGKGGRDYLIPLSLEMRNILWPLQGHHDSVVFTYVVQRTRDGRKRGDRSPITVHGLKTEFRRAREAAGIPSTGEDFERGYRWHDNRHTRATRLLRLSGNLRLVQRILGHSRIETTVRYAHVQMDDLRQILDTEFRQKSYGEGSEIEKDERLKDVKGS